MFFSGIMHLWAMILLVCVPYVMAVANLEPNGLRKQSEDQSNEKFISREERILQNNHKNFEEVDGDALPESEEEIFNPFSAVNQTANPTNAPSKAPTKAPTSTPTNAPTKAPTSAPSKAPSSAPSKAPTSSPTKNPTASPNTKAPTNNPRSPSVSPTSNPTRRPTTSFPTNNPTRNPTANPTTKTPTGFPTENPTNKPTTGFPTKKPSRRPTSTPTTRFPTQNPTSVCITYLTKEECKSQRKKCMWNAKKSKCLAVTKSPTQKPVATTNGNILMFVLDDLKPLFKSWGSPYADTPNIDRIAEMGINFLNAHAQMAICGPSRASFLTSRRPDTLKIWNIGIANILNNKRTFYMRENDKNMLTIPAYLKLNGYRTYGLGKIYHGNEWIEMKDSDSWTEPVYTYHSDRSSPFYPRPPSFDPPYQGSWIAWTRAGDTALPDGQMGQLAADLLSQIMSDDSSPWFLAIGHYSPHLPWHAPEEDFNEFSDIDFFGAHHGSIPEFMDQEDFRFVKGSGCGEVGLYSGAPSGGLTGQSSTTEQKRAIHAYHAATRFADRQIGKVLDVLFDHPDADRTHIILLGDHGFHLGDHGLYCKHTNFEQATRTPLIIAPAGADNRFRRGVMTAAPVELLDILPTIADLTGLPHASENSDLYAEWEGVSLFPIMEDPDEGFVKQGAFSQYFRNNIWGYSMRTVRYRFTTWLTMAVASQASPPFKSKVAELYEYIDDGYEKTNFAYSNDRDALSIYQQFTSGYSVWTTGGESPEKFSTANGEPPHDAHMAQQMKDRLQSVEFP